MKLRPSQLLLIKASILAAVDRHRFFSQILRYRTLTWILTILSLTFSGCSLIHVYSAANDDRSLPGPPLQLTRATMTIRESDLSRGAFVGIAMSGGGARAANFAAATLLELEELGFLQHASAISAVSGSALTAAYYGLYGRSDQAAPERAKHWGDEPVRRRFLVDFETHWMVWWFNPWNTVRYWFTDFDRSDIMKDVFDMYLFARSSGPTFSDMGSSGPRILINASTPLVRALLEDTQAEDAVCRTGGERA